MLYDVPLRRTTKRKRIINEIGIICKRNNIPIKVNLNCFPYYMMVLAKVKLLCGEGKD